MCCKGFLKRVLPFMAALAVGIFITSFFVTIGGARMPRRGWERHREFERMQLENYQLKAENGQLHDQIDMMQRQGDRPHCKHRIDATTDEGSFSLTPADLPPPPPMPPAVPAAPRVHR